MKNPILIVDDEPRVVLAFQRALMNEPYDIHFAFNGEKALRILDRDPVKVIISDERMPRLSGIELLSTAKTRFPRIVRIMLTGVAELETVVKAVNQAEVYRVFIKPWNNAEMVAALRSAVRKHDMETEREELSKCIESGNEGLEKIKENPVNHLDERECIIMPELSDEEIDELLSGIKSRNS